MKRLFAMLALCVALPCLGMTRTRDGAPPVLPTLTTSALSGQSVSLPEDLARLNVVIVGFTRSSVDRTTAWEKPIRRELLPTGVRFYDVAELETQPKFMRSVIIAMIRNKVPSVLKPHFLTLFEDDLDWKRAVGFDPHATDDAYVVIADADGRVLWQTHEAFSDEAFDRLKRELKRRGMR